MSKKLEGIGLNGMEFSSNEYLIGTHGNQNPWGHFCATCAIYHENGPKGLNWQCSLAGSSKMDFIFFDYHGCQNFILA